MVESLQFFLDYNMSQFLPSTRQKKSHPLNSILTEEDYALAQESRKKEDQKEENFQKELIRRRDENFQMMSEMDSVRKDGEITFMNERKKRVKKESVQRYLRDTKGTFVNKREEKKWQLWRKKKNREVDVKSLKSKTERSANTHSNCE